MGKELILNVYYEEGEYGEDDIISEQIFDEKYDIFFGVDNLDDCPEDAIIGRSLFDVDGYIRALNKGIELAQKGYVNVKANWIKEEE